MPQHNGMRTFDFDPRIVGRMEMENWAAYYQRRWLKLLVVSVRMVRESFGLSWLQAMYGAYLVARAEFAAAPADNDIPLAERFMRRYYAMVKRVHGAAYDVEAVARAEVNWWIVHRRLFGQRENGELVEALEALYSLLFDVPRTAIHEAAYRRAEAMIHSDRWVQEGRKPGDPLLQNVEDELIQSYAALRQAVLLPSAPPKIAVTEH